MKLGKTAWIILGAGIFIIAFISLYMVFLQQSGERKDLSEVLLAAQQDLSRLQSERSSLASTLAEIKDELAQVTSRLTTAKAAFPTSVESIEIDEQLFAMAEANRLDITSLTASEPKDEEENENVTYSVATFTADVRGEVTDIIDFIETMASHKDFKTATVELVNMTVPAPLTEEEKEGLTQEEIEEAETPTATIELVIYGYKGG